MIQQINLYLPEYRRIKPWLNLVSMLQICAVVVVLLMVSTVPDRWRSYKVGSEVEDIQATLDEARARTSEAEGNVRSQLQDPALADNELTLEQEVLRARNWLAFLQQTNLGNVKGFSEYFKDIARFGSEEDELWITGFSFLQGGNVVSISGLSQNPGLVPAFIDSLITGKSEFKNHDLSDWSVDLEGDFYRFQLSSK